MGKKKVGNAFPQEKLIGLTVGPLPKPMSDGKGLFSTELSIKTNFRVDVLFIEFRTEHFGGLQNATGSWVIGMNEMNDQGTIREKAKGSVRCPFGFIEVIQHARIGIEVNPTTFL